MKKSISTTPQITTRTITNKIIPRKTMLANSPTTTNRMLMIKMISIKRGFKDKKGSSNKRMIIPRDRSCSLKVLLEAP